MKMRKALEDAGIKKKKYHIKENISHYNSMNSGRNELLVELNTLSISIDEDEIIEVLKNGVKGSFYSMLCEAITMKGANYTIRQLAKELANTENIFKIGRDE